MVLVAIFPGSRLAAVEVEADESVDPGLGEQIRHLLSETDAGETDAAVE